MTSRIVIDLDDAQYRRLRAVAGRRANSQTISPARSSRNCFKPMSRARSTRSCRRSTDANVTVLTAVGICRATQLADANIAQRNAAWPGIGPAPRHPPNQQRPVQ